MRQLRCHYTLGGWAPVIEGVSILIMQSSLNACPVVAASPISWLSLVRPRSTFIEFPSRASCRCRSLSFLPVVFASFTIRSTLNEFKQKSVLSNAIYLCLTILQFTNIQRRYFSFTNYGSLRFKFYGSYHIYF